MHSQQRTKHPVMLVVEVYSQLCVHYQYYCCYGNYQISVPRFYAPPTISVLYMKTVLKYWEEFVGVAEIVVYMCVFDLTDVFMFMCVIRRRRCC